MNLLGTEYNAETHRRIFARDYAKEKVEERDIEYATEMLREGDSIDKIARLTKLPIETIEKLRKTVIAVES